MEHRSPEDQRADPYTKSTQRLLSRSAWSASMGYVVSIPRQRDSDTTSATYGDPIVSTCRVYMFRRRKITAIVRLWWGQHIQLVQAVVNLNSKHTAVGILVEGSAN